MTGLESLQVQAQSFRFLAFSNSITSPAIEAKSEGIIYGICVKMFTIAGPVIVIGLVASLITGIIYMFI